MNGNLAWWIEIPVALLLVLSGVFALAAGVGVVRFKTFFQRMHPPALAYSFAAWCVTLASIVYFSAQDDKLALRSWLIIIFLALTVPVTTILLARTELFRRRTASGGGGLAGRDDIPPGLNHESAAPVPADPPR